MNTTNQENYKDKKVLMSPMEMAKHLGIGRTTAYALIKEPGFPRVKIGSRVYVFKESLHKWLESKERDANNRKGVMLNE